VSDFEIMCSWCGLDPAIGEDIFQGAPTCQHCSTLVSTRPFGWRRHGVGTEDPDLDGIGGLSCEDVPISGDRL
jgi:hypothetical protein